MTRKYLEELGLEGDVIDKIMSENGNDIEKARKSEQGKFSTERSQLQGQIEDLQGQISTRDADLTSLNEQLNAAQADAGKLVDAQSALASLQSKYDEEQQAWAAKAAKQAYEFAVKTEAGKLKFSSAAARKEFIREAIAQEFKQDGDTLMGYSDFVAKYKEADPGAFIADEPTPAPTPEPVPKIVLPGNPSPQPAKKSLTEMMRAKNENPNMEIRFD